MLLSVGQKCKLLFQGGGVSNRVSQSTVSVITKNKTAKLGFSAATSCHTEVRADSCTFSMSAGFLWVLGPPAHPLSSVSFRLFLIFVAGHFSFSCLYYTVPNSQCSARGSHPHTPAGSDPSPLALLQVLAYFSLPSESFFF